MTTQYIAPPPAYPHSMPHRMVAERDTMINRGDLFSACLDPVVGSEQGGIRPVLVIQNDVGNRYSPTVIVLAVTGQLGKARLPTHVPIACEGTGLVKDSVVLAEQIRTLDKRRLRERIGRLDARMMDEVERAISVSFGLSGAAYAPARAVPSAGAPAAASRRRDTASLPPDGRPT